MNKYDKTHLRNVSRSQNQIDAFYRKIIREAVAVGASVSDVGKDIFSFDTHPELKRRVQALLDDYQQGVYGIVVNGINAAWTLSNNKNSELSRRVFGDNVGKLTQEQYRRYFSTNDDARQAFISRKTAGLNLSDRVWKYTDQFKTEIELGLDVGIRGGQSAADMARDLQQYLQHPDRLFRRVRDEHGDLQLSKAAAACHHGQGVYRSSYRNARRLAATETNMAYRSADYERWQQLDFVVGIEIKLSGNHTTHDGKGNIVPLTDICDELAGRYPKDFKFTGWHPNCRCHAETILKTEKEMKADTEKILRGEETDGESVNRVEDVPERFKGWLKDNKGRSEQVYSTPYFVTDNMKYVPEKFMKAYGSRLPYKTYAEYEQAMKYNREHGGFTPEQWKNIRELNKVLPVMQGKIMNFTEADSGFSNPHHSDADADIAGFCHNCQTCTVAYELRRRGFNIEALPNPVVEGYRKTREMDLFYHRYGMNCQTRFIGSDGKFTPYSWSKGVVTEDSVEAKHHFIESMTTIKGRYEIHVQWNSTTGHVFCLERQPGGRLLWFDPQSGRKGDYTAFKDFLGQMMPDKIGILRVDDKLINPKMSRRLKVASK